MIIKIIIIIIIIIIVIIIIIIILLIWVFFTPALPDWCTLESEFQQVFSSFQDFYNQSNRSQQHSCSNRSKQCCSLLLLLLLLLLVVVVVVVVVVHLKSYNRWQTIHTGMRYLKNINVCQQQIIIK